MNALFQWSLQFPQSMLSVAWTHLWQVTLVAAIALLTVRLLGRNRPHLSHAIWALVLLKSITPPVLCSPVSPFGWVTAAGTPAAVQPAPASYSSGSPTEPSLITAPEYLLTPVPESDRRPSKQAVESAGSVADDGTLSWLFLAGWLSWIWLAVALAMLIFQALHLAIFLHSAARSSQPTPEWLSEMTRELQRELRIHRRVRVAVIDTPIGPAVTGLLHPTILLPQLLLAELDREAARHLLAHELIHIRRGDLWWAIVQVVAACGWWFHPLVRRATSDLSQEAERSCDAEVIASLGCAPAAYARTLMEMLERKHQLQVAPALPGVRPVEVTARRIERIMKLGNGIPKHRSRWIAAGLLVGAAIILPGAGTGNAQEEDDAAKPAKKATGPLRPAPVPQQTYASPAEYQLQQGYKPGDHEKVQLGKPAAVQEYQVEHLEVADIIAQLTNEQRTKHQAASDFLSCVPHYWQEIDLADDRSMTLPHGLNCQFVLDGGEICTLGGKEPPVKLIGSTLHVFGSHRDRQLVRNHVDHVRQSKLGLISTRALILKVDARELNLRLDELSTMRRATNAASGPSASLQEAGPSVVLDQDQSEQLKAMLLDLNETEIHARPQLAAISGQMVRAIVGQSVQIPVHRPDKSAATRSMNVGTELTVSATRNAARESLAVQVKFRHSAVAAHADPVTVSSVTADGKKETVELPRIVTTTAESGVTEMAYGETLLLICNALEQEEPNRKIAILLDCDWVPSPLRMAPAAQIPQDKLDKAWVNVTPMLDSKQTKVVQAAFAEHEFENYRVERHQIQVRGAEFRLGTEIATEALRKAREAAGEVPTRLPPAPLDADLK